MTGAEEYNVMGFEFVEDVGFRVVIEGKLGRIGKLWNDNKNSNEE